MTDHLACPICDHTVEVSRDDPDASTTDMHDHLSSSHTGYNADVALALLEKVKVVIK